MSCVTGMRFAATFFENFIGFCYLLSWLTGADLVRKVSPASLLHGQQPELHRDPPRCYTCQRAISPFQETIPCRPNALRAPCFLRPRRFFIPLQLLLRSFPAIVLPLSA